MTTARSLTLGWKHLAVAGALLVATVIALSVLFSYVTVRHAAEIRLPFLQDLMRGITAEESQKRSDYVRDNLNVMATKLGQMQAQLLRLDSLGERLAAVSGIKLQDTSKIAPERDGRGGPLVNPSPLSPNELQQAVESLSRQLEAKTDTLTLLEAQLFEERVRKARLPTTLPVAAQWNASTYGWRIDPFTGERAMHQGVDFPADVGTPIVAAAAGVVVAAERHAEYGMMVDIDHGDGLVTRYAHASKVLVKEGAFIKRGQKIAEVGSSGRSTGPHLHFEVRSNGSPQNPNRFLQLAANSKGRRH